MKFENLLEKISNPLRKQSLIGQPNNIEISKKNAEDWKDYIRRGNITDPDDLAIREKYNTYNQHFPDRAERWLDQEAKKFGSLFLRQKSEGRRKIYSKFGIDVYLDKYADQDFDKNPKNMKMLDDSIIQMVQYINELLPNKKPNIIITDESSNPLFIMVGGAAGVYRGKLIFIDQNHIETKYFIHEYAHYVADLVPQQSEPMLKKAYNDMLDSYWRRVKRKRQKLQPEDSRDPKQIKEAEKWRRKIAQGLGYPDQYGLTNFDEFFAVLIENWKTMKNNQATYRFKTVVKQILTRL